jgi:hypothetical protein
MALRTAAERAQRLAAWKADPRNKGLKPPVEIDPPGLHAPRRATVAQKKVVQEVYRQHARDLERLGLEQIHKLAPVLNQAQLGGAWRSVYARAPLPAATASNASSGVTGSSTSRMQSDQTAPPRQPMRRRQYPHHVCDRYNEPHGQHNPIGDRQS